MKRLLAFFMLSAMLLSLCCGCAQPAQTTEVASEAEPAAPAETAAPADTQDGLIALAFLCKNKTGYDLAEMYVYPAGAAEHGENVLPEMWPNNTEKSQYQNIIIARENVKLYDITLVTTDGTELTFTGLSLRYSNTVSMSADEIEAKSSDEYTISDEQILAAGVTCKRAEPEINRDVAVQLRFVFKNKSGKDITEAYIYPSGDTDKGADLCAGTPWKNVETADGYLWLDFPSVDASVYDLYFVFADGTDVLYTARDLQHNNSVSIKNSDLELSVKQDDTFIPDQQLVFVLKNKTGKEATAIYLYPAGSENRYENILTENWPTCEDESQYRYIVIERPIAETYEMTAEFADGTTLSYEAFSMDGMNSISMKDAEGTVSVKNDPDIADAITAAAAAGLTTTYEASATALADENGMVTLRFVFKNKTGKDIAEAYVYPLGSEDRFENIVAAYWTLGDFWPIHVDDSDYMHLTLQRPAGTYVVEIVFTDGETHLYDNDGAGFDLVNNNSVSMKEIAGGLITVKFDAEVDYSEF